MTANGKAALLSEVGTLSKTASITSLANKSTINQTIFQQPLTPDLDQARRHLRWLDPHEEKFVFQTFDDDKERKSKNLIRRFHGTLDQYAEVLTRLNKDGAGIFVTVNRSSNGGRKKGDIDGCRVVFREADEPNLPDLPLDPHLRIESSPGKHHDYLLIERTDDFKTWDGVMNTMVTVHGSDPNAKDRSRVLRLPGFYHQKDPSQPHMVKIVHESGTQRYSLAEVAQHIQPTEKIKAKAATASASVNMSCYKTLKQERAAKASASVNPRGTGSKYGLAALDKELEALAETPEGGRNAQLNTAVFSLGQLVAGGELDEDLVKRKLLSMAISIGLSETEAQATIKSGLDAGAKAPRTAPTTSMNDEEWPDSPVSLGLPELPSVTNEDFPPDLWAMVDAVSKSTETPPELAGLLALAVSATVCQKRWLVEPEPGYHEPLNIMTTAGLPSGNRKSAVLKIIILPLTEWEIEQAQIQAPLIKSVQFVRDSQDARLKEMQKQFAKEKDEKRRQDISSQMEEINSKLQEVPVKPQLMAQDITPERLGSLMAIHGERMALFSAEGGIFDIIAGRYSNGAPNLDIFLQAHAGDSVHVDRGSRESLWLKAPALTMGLCIQPDVIKGLASKPGFRGRGLLGRILYALPPSLLGHRTLKSMPIPADIEFSYKRTIRLLLEMPPPEVPEDIPIIKFSPEALKEWKDFQRWVETGLAEGGEFEHMRDWAGKLPGAAARIAGLFHCYEHAGKKPHEHPVSLLTMDRALSLAKKLSRHALAVYDLMEADVTIEGARKILRWIIRTGSVSFTGHDCHSALKGTFKTRKELDPALQALGERGYIRKFEEQGEKRPGRPRGTYIVHPSIQVS
jgi:hypothetical protein